MSGRFARECARAGVRDSRQCRQSPSTQRLRVVTESIWRFVGSIWWSSWISRFEQDVCRYHISLALLHITFDILLEARGSGSKGSSTAACITFVSHGSGSGQWDFRLVADLSTFLRQAANAPLMLPLLRLLTLTFDHHRAQCYIMSKVST